MSYPRLASSQVAYMDMYSALWLPRWHDGKESTCQCRRRKRCGFYPWLRKIPWSRKWQLTPVFSLGKFHGQRSLVGYGPWGHKGTAQWLSISPLQAYSPSCLLIPWLASMLLDILMWIIITPGITHKSFCYVPHAFLAAYINSYFSWQSSNIGIWRLREFTYLVQTVQLILIGD